MADADAGTWVRVRFSIMALRIGGLSDLDVLTVPLPAGTEITTRVDREFDGMFRPQGVVGRVVGRVTGATSGGAAEAMGAASAVNASGTQSAGATISAPDEPELIEVVFLDGKRGRYLRGELVPRKLGVVRYAQRREASWQALRPCVVLEARVGSRAWGLANEHSDEDHRGVFALPMPWTTGLVDPPLDLVSLDGSSTYWEIGKAVRQALRADPNTLEMLFADPVASDELGQALIDCREAFLSREIYGSFGRYALSQLDRLEHNQRLADHRGLLLGWLAAEPALTLDAAAVRLADSAAIAAPTPKDAMLRGRDYIKQLYRSMYDQGALTSNDWDALVAFSARRAAGAASGEAAGAESDFSQPRDLRPKNAYNLIRLLDLAIRLLRGEPPSVRVSEALRPTLLAIKQGLLPMGEVMQMARQLTPELEAARDKSPLPATPDIATVERMLRKVRETTARRWVLGAPGPWGKDAPEPAVASFDSGKESAAGSDGAKES
jgi:RNA repair pathway DNA polymerase beta family